MGGGSVRARFAAAALNYTRGNDDWRNSQDSTAYYDIVDNDNSNDNRTTLAASSSSSSSSSRAYFCNSKLPNYRYYQENRTYEGTLPCRALTPLGQAVACPGVSFDACLGCPIQQTNNNNIDGTADASCHRVYVGHNLLGNEIHHLPPQWLAQWWQTQQLPQQGGNNRHAQQQQQQQHDYHAQISTYMRRIQVDSTSSSTPSWCTSERVGRPQTPRQALQYHTKCSIPLAQTVGELATQWIQSVSSLPASAMTTQSMSSFVEQQQQESPMSSSSLLLSPPLPFDTSIHWGPLYASLPVLRTTVVREPFSWFLSKFAWHGHGRSYACDNVTAATFRPHLYREQGEGGTTWYPETRARGWAHRHALGYILHLCGEDCNIRYAHAQAQLGTNFRESHERALIESFLRQADYNLRHSIAVVGLQDDMDGFYDMVTARIQYMNMSRNSHVQGPRHASAATDACRDTFASPAFRRTLMDASPAIVAAVRLYETAVRVHAFQQQELQGCSSLQ